MMLRKLAVSLAVAGIMGVSNANALGLGEIKINSALNEPLNAEIKLLQVRKLSPLQIQPRMADVDEFALAGLDKSRFLTGVRFQVKVNPDGTGVIYISSDRPVREPFLNFLVELNWPNGRLVREYTLLLDPPVFDPTPVRQTVQPAAALPSPARSSFPKKEAVDNIRTRAVGNQQIYVDVKDTLWSIALKNKPNPSVSAKQLMIALQRKNPHAFVDNNINKLKAGVVLNMPSLAEIKALNDQQAAQEVVRQTSTWKSGSSTAAPVDAAKKQIDTTKESEQTKKAEQEKPAPEQTPDDAAEKASAELKIVTPKESANKGNETTDQSADPDAVLDAEKEELAQRNIELETRLSESLENTDKIARENAELNERMDSIQYELEKLREMLELKDKEMAQLQDKVNAAPEAPAEPAPAPAPEEKGLLDKLMQSPLLLGGIGAGLLAVLAGLFFFLKRRKNNDEPAVEEEASVVQVPDDLDEADESTEADDISETEFETDDLEFDAEDQELLAEDENDLDDDLSDLDDLDDLDLDMDLDLDLEEETIDDSIEKVEKAESDDDDALLADDEFDLGLDEDDEEPVEDESSDEDLVSEDSGLDDILGEAEESEEELLDVASDDLDAILGDVQDEDDLEIEDANLDLDDSNLDVEDSDLAVDDSDLDDILGDVQDDSELEVDDTELEVDDSDLDDILGEVAEPEADEVDLDLDSDLEFNIEAPEPQSELQSELQPESDESKEDSSVDDSGDLEFEVTESVAESIEAPTEETDATIDQMDADEVSEDALDALLDSVSDEGAEVEEFGSDEPDLDNLSLTDELDVEPEDLTVEDSSAATLDDDLEALLEDSSAEVEEPALEDMLVEEAPVEEAQVEELGADEGVLDVDGQDADLGLDLEGAEEFESSPDIDELISETATMVDLEEAQANETSVGDLDVQSADDLDLDVSNDDLDAMLDEIGMDLDETDLSEDEGDNFKAKSSEELEAVIGHDLDAELDSLLSETDDGIELDESDDADLGLDEDFDELAGLNLLEGADEVETKLDLARAYLDMEDLDGAKDILQEVAAEGSDAQKLEAEALISSINEK